MNAPGRSSATRRTDEYKEFRVISVDEPLLDGHEKNTWPRVSWRALVIDPTRAVERLNAWHYGSLLDLPEVQRVDLEDFAEPWRTPGRRLSLGVC
jgi:hypothetical protein